MDTSLRPQFFISRQDGSLTPLIAADELPQLMSIRGVPRLLSQNDTQGMTSLGSANHRGQYYVIDCLPPGTVTVIEQKTMPAGPKNGNRNGKDTKAGQRNQKGNSKKEYCSFWLRHGECDYQQQGCIFKHEMPRDASTLEKLGLRDIPRWYREKHNVKSMAANIENVKSRANRSNVQTLLHAKQNHSFGRMANEASLDGCDMPLQYPSAFAAGTQGHANGVHAPQGHNAHAMVNQPTFSGHTNGNNKLPASSALVDVFGPYKHVDTMNPDNLVGHQKMDTVTNTLKDKDSFEKMGYAFDPRHPVHFAAPTTAANVTEVKKAQPVMGNYMHKNGALNGTIDHVMVPRQNGKATPALKLATKSPWILHKDKADFSELPMSPFVPPNPASEFADDQDQSKKKQQKSRRLYQPRFDSKTFNGQNKVTATNGFPLDNLHAHMSAFYPFGDASPRSRDGVHTPNNNAIVGSNSSPGSSGRNSSARSSHSSLANGNNNKDAPDNLYFERTASMTSHIFEMNECAREKGFERDLLFDLGLNGEA